MFGTSAAGHAYQLFGGQQPVQFAVTGPWPATELQQAGTGPLEVEKAPGLAGEHVADPVAEVVLVADQRHRAGLAGQPR